MGRKTQGWSQRKLSEELCKRSCLSTILLSNGGARTGVPSPGPPAAVHSRGGSLHAEASLRQGCPRGICGLMDPEWLTVSAGENAVGLVCKPGGGRGRCSEQGQWMEDIAHLSNMCRREVQPKPKGGRAELERTVTDLGVLLV